jgi:hypothetical protein
MRNPASVHPPYGGWGVDPTPARRCTARSPSRGRRTIPARVDLRRMHERTVTVRIEARTTGAHRSRSKRRYRVCGA